MKENFLNPRILTPISHLAKNKFFFNLVGAFGGLEARDNVVPHAQRNNVLMYHCKCEITQRWSASDHGFIEQRVRGFRSLKGVSFHMVTNNTSFKVCRGRAVGDGEELSASVLLKNAKTNIDWFRNRFSGLEILVENNNDLGGRAYTTVTEPWFIAELVRQNQIKFLYDHAHAMISAVAQRQTFTEYFSNLPLEAVFQVHLSSPVVTDTSLIDAHNPPDGNQIKFCLQNFGDRCAFYTVEYYKSLVQLIETLENLKKSIRQITHNR